MFYIDTHCHLDLLEGIDKNPAIEDKLPIKSITVTNAPFLFQPNNELFSNAKNIRVALGMHPELVTQYYRQMDMFESQLPFTKYIGEIGLDGSPNHFGSFALQKKTFENILSLVSSAGSKILTIHSRSAAAETITLLHKHLKKSDSNPILHWFSGSLPELREALQHNYFFSVNHKMTTTKKGLEIISHIPLENIVTETDAPFTLDSKINTRIKSLEKTIVEIALIKHKSPEEMKELIFQNFKRILS